jgi:hypothetical protein
MSPKRLLIAVVLLALAGGGVWWSNRLEKEKEGKPAPDGPPQLLAIKDDQIQGLEFHHAGGETIVLERTDAARWKMVEPKSPSGQEYAVDLDTVLQVMNSVSNLSADRVVEEKPSNLKEFGLDKPGFQLTVRKKDGKSEVLEIGDDSPAGGSAFAKLAGDPRVFTIGSWYRNSLGKKLSDLRDKRLLIFESDKISRLELAARKETFEFGRVNNTDWQIVKPRPLRADGWQVEELIRKLRDARMDLSLASDEANKAAAAFSSGSVVAKVSVTDPSGSQTLEVRKSKDDYYARSSRVDGVHKVTAELGTGLDKSLDDFRNKKLFDFGFQEPGRIVVKDGDKTVLLEKSGEKWKAGSQTMDATSVQAFLDKARDIAAEKFADGKTLPAATLEVVVDWEGGKRSDKVLFARSGDSWLARRENEPSVYVVASKNVEELQKLAGEIKAEQLAKPESGKTPGK